MELLGALKKNGIVIYLVFKEIDGIYLSNGDDIVAWSWNEKNGKLIVKLAYEAIFFSSVEVEQSWWFNSLWKVMIH